MGKATVAANAQGRKRPLTVCLVGMPNAGKTTLMNALTDSSFYTANYPGVTVTLASGRSKPRYGSEELIIDLPGISSPASPSPEEELACKVLDGQDDTIRPDALIVVVDATQVERHLRLASYVARCGKPMVICLTMTDLLPRMKLTLDVQKLEHALGVPVVEVDARSGKGLAKLMQLVREAAQRQFAMQKLAQIPQDPVAAYDALSALLKSSGALSTLHPGIADEVTNKIDAIVLHRWFGLPIFFLILAVLFASIFWAAQPLMDIVDTAFTYTQAFLAELLPPGFLTELFSEGIIGGVGAVAVFFPQIMILLFLMTFLEDTGYLARGAVLVDRPLAFLGLHGRSLVPMLSGFACAIPAVLAARTIPTARERLLTIWVIPLMSCSARLPVYSLLIAALFTGRKSWIAGLVLSGIYFTSLLAAAFTAGLVSRLLAKRHRRSLSLLAMELPVYRMPQLRPILKLTWARSSSYLQKAALPIITVSAVLWLLSNYGYLQYRYIARTSLEQSFAASLGQLLEPMLEPMGADWRVGIGLISAFAAREAFVSSMALVFRVAEEDENTREKSLLECIRAARLESSGKPLFTTSTIIGLMCFFFFSLQCASTVAVVRHETSTRFALIQLAFYTSLGYIVAVLIVQGLRLTGFA
ncbi:MAG: ferrous iron transporter B [Acidobacteriota bacterium]|nr:ferrous iron transporter B [Blastocatellia bacterium]MDW8412755.1 ferrous iron transporter B [Acidobacteriota bacterium]